MKPNWKQIRDRITGPALAKEIVKVENELRRHFAQADCYCLATKHGNFVRVRVIDAGFHGASEFDRAQRVEKILNQPHLPTAPDHVVILAFCMTPEENVPTAVKNLEFEGPLEWQHNAGEALRRLQTPKAETCSTSLVRAAS